MSCAQQWKKAHKRGLKITGHLCSIGFREAAELGIDNLEHGLIVDSEFVPNKEPDKCPAGDAVSTSLRQLDLNGAAAVETIRTLVAKKCRHYLHSACFRSGRRTLDSERHWRGERYFESTHVGGDES